MNCNDASNETVSRLIHTIRIKAYNSLLYQQLIVIPLGNRRSELQQWHCVKQCPPEKIKTYTNTYINT